VWWVILQSLPLWGWIAVWCAIISVALIGVWVWKSILVPTLAVAIDKDSYDRTETVQITGSVKQGTTPLANKTVKISIQPPAGGDAYSLPDVLTDASGVYTSTWEIPDDAVGGTYTLVVTCLGMLASKTFRQTQISLS